MSIGYLSKASVAGQEVLATSCSVSPKLQRLDSSGARGAGWKNAGLSTYKFDYYKYEGDINWDVTKGTLCMVAKYAIDDRGASTDSGNFTIEATPGNAYKISATGWCTSFSAEASEGQLVTASAGVLAFSGSFGSAGGGYSPTGSGGSTWCGGDNLIPYWMSSATCCYGGSSTCATQWSFQVDNSFVPVFCCNGKRDACNNQPTAVLAGEQQATMSMSFFGLNGGASFPTSCALFNECSASIDTGDGTATLNRAVIESCDVPLQTGDSIIVASFTFRGTACADGPITFNC